KELTDIYTNALKSKNIDVIWSPKILISVQGGVGTTEEHNFLLQHYHMDSVGWGSPFLLVPEVMNVDEETIDQLCKAGEDDFYMSDASPLGVKFNNFRPSSDHAEKYKRFEEGKPGFTCLKGMLVSDTSFTEKPICTASRQYMRERSKEIERQNLSAEEKAKALNKMIQKSCLCVGLSTTTLRFHHIPVERNFVAICPGPNLAYFSKKATLHEMVDHIYGVANIIETSSRPHMFIKEISLYVEHLKEKIEEYKTSLSEKSRQYILNFKNKMQEGIQYYRQLIPELKEESEKVKDKMREALQNFEMILNGLLAAV
ncbi:MAG TPA: hypothetical protein VN132_13120, partial [Bdellovibrio sp.]|nr:hypothetical protein [Bdellovibrio sp.]